MPARYDSYGKRSLHVLRLRSCALLDSPDHVIHAQHSTNMKTGNFVWPGFVATLAIVAIVIVALRSSEKGKPDAEASQNEINAMSANASEHSTALVPSPSELAVDASAADRSRVTATTAATPVTPPTGGASGVETLTTPPAVVSLAQLQPTMGGNEALAARYRDVSFDDRRTRLTEIEQGLDAYLQIEKHDPSDSDLYQALKDELYWLRDNLEPKKP
jgi:hypothetical protein